MRIAFKVLSSHCCLCFVPTFDFMKVCRFWPFPTLGFKCMVAHLHLWHRRCNPSHPWVEVANPTERGVEVAAMVPLPRRSAMVNLPRIYQALRDETVCRTFVRDCIAIATATPTAIVSAVAIAIITASAVVLAIANRRCCFCCCCCYWA